MWCPRLIISIWKIKNRLFDVEQSIVFGSRRLKLHVVKINKSKRTILTEFFELYSLNNIYHASIWKIWLIIAIENYLVSFSACTLIKECVWKRWLKNLYRNHSSWDSPCEKTRRRKCRCGDWFRQRSRCRWDEVRSTPAAHCQDSWGNEGNHGLGKG